MKHNTVELTSINNYQPKKYTGLTEHSCNIIKYKRDFVKTKQYHIFLREKFEIANGKDLFNKGSEIIDKCLHKQKVTTDMLHILKETVTIKPR